MAKESVNVGLEIEGLRETIRAFRALDDQSKVEAKASSKRVAELLASAIRAATPTGDRRYTNLGQTVRSTVGRNGTPGIDIGGRVNPRVSGGGTPANLIIGMEFGANQAGRNGWRFPPRTPRLGRGNEGYWVYPTARAKQREVVSLWQNSLNSIINDWSR